MWPIFKLGQDLMIKNIKDLHMIAGKNVRSYGFHKVDFRWWMYRQWMLINGWMTDLTLFNSLVTSHVYIQSDLHKLIQ